MVIHMINFVIIAIKKHKIIICRDIALISAIRSLIPVTVESGLIKRPLKKLSLVCIDWFSVDLHHLSIPPREYLILHLSREI